MNVSMLEVVPEVSYKPFFEYFQSFCCSDWVLFASVYFKLLIGFSASSTLLLNLYKLLSILVSVSFISDSFFFYGFHVFFYI